jgi:hypothetical protein
LYSDDAEDLGTVALLLLDESAKNGEALVYFS